MLHASTNLVTVVEGKQSRQTNELCLEESGLTVCTEQRTNNQSPFSNLHLLFRVRIVVTLNNRF